MATKTASIKTLKAKLQEYEELRKFCDEKDDVTDEDYDRLEDLHVEIQDGIDSLSNSPVIRFLQELPEGFSPYPVISEWVDSWC